MQMIDTRIKLFLSDVEDISIGFSSFDFFEKENFAVGQIGYRMDGQGNSLITGHEGS